MRNGITLAAAGFAFIGGTLAAAGTTRAATPKAPTATDCIATIATPIVVGVANQEVTVSISEALTDSVTVNVAPESNLRVSGVTNDIGSKLLKVQVDATNGAPGTWGITLTGKNTSCKGQVKVAVGG